MKAQPNRRIGTWLSAGLAALVAALMVPACAVKRTKIAAGVAPPPPQPATAAELLDRVEKQRAAVQTLNMTVGLEPTAGSAYTGVISQYHDVKAFILVQSPAKIRILVQAPVVRTTILDMASDGKEFRVWVPTKQKFLVGATDAAPTAKNSLENLRPQHILDALLVPMPAAESPQVVLYQERNGLGIDWVLDVVKPGGGEPLTLSERFWFAGASHDLDRYALYDPSGAVTEDVKYASYQDYGGVRYPSQIDLERPIEAITLGISVEKATLNQPIAPEKFVLAKPPGVEPVQVGSAGPREVSVGQ